MNEDINWDEIRSDDSLLRPAKLFEQGVQRNNAYGSSTFENSEGMDAPLLRDETYSEVPIQDGITDHCHWSPKVVHKAAGPQLLAATIMCAIFMIGELIGGYLAGSLAIMCDAAHLLSDCAGFLLALSALWLARRPPGPRMSFGYRRAEVLGALMSIMLIWLVTGIFVYLAMLRLWEGSYDIQVNAMMIVSGVGMCVNILMALILHGACPGIAHAHSHGGASSSHAHSHDAHTHTSYSEASKTSSKAKNGYRNLGMDSAENGTITSGVNENSAGSNGSMGHSHSTSLLGITINKNVQMPKKNAFGSMNGEYSLKDVTSHEGANGSGNGYGHAGFDDVELLGAGGRLSASQAESCASAEQSINVRAAAIHVLGDLIQSAGVFLASVIIKIYPEAKIVDPLCTFVFSIIVMCTTVKILREATNVLMEGVPTQVRYESVLAALRGLAGVRAVHSLHIWSITNQQNMLSAHLAIDQYTDFDSTLKQALHIIRTKFRIDLATIQVERYSEEAMAACVQCSANTDT